MSVTRSPQKSTYNLRNRITSTTEDTMATSGATVPATLPSYTQATTTEVTTTTFTSGVPIMSTSSTHSNQSTSSHGSSETLLVENHDNTTNQENRQITSTLPETTNPYVYIATNAYTRPPPRQSLFAPGTSGLHLRNAGIVTTTSGRQLNYNEGRNNMATATAIIHRTPPPLSINGGSSTGTQGLPAPSLTQCQIGGTRNDGGQQFFGDPRALTPLPGIRLPGADDGYVYGGEQEQIPHPNAANQYNEHLPTWRDFLQTVTTPLPPAPEFSGRDHEDPQRFLQEIGTYCRVTNRHPDHWTKIAGKSLKGDAEKWWETYKSLQLNWERFQELILIRFDGPTTKSKLYAQLYSQRQGDKEPAGVFLQKKIQLFDRLHPGAPRQLIVPALLELLRPAIRQAIRASQPREFDALLLRALEAETDETEVSRAPMRRERTVMNDHGPTSTPVVSSSPRKCWHCPGYHLHRDCPVIQQRQAERQPPENWRRPAGPPQPVVTKNSTQ